MKKTYIIFGSIIITSVILGPILINELYKFSDGYKTAWGPIELLVYYGAVLSFIGTTFLGMITVSLNKKSNDISDRLLSIQESNSNNRIMPVLKMHSAQKGKFTGGYLLDDKTLYYYVDETPLVLGGNMHSMFTRFLKFELKSITDILSLDIQLKSLIFNGKTLFLKHSIGNADYINILKSDMGIDIYLLFDEKLYEKMICSNERKLTFQIIMKNI
ncbi:MAG TPA: hypothetical protein DHM90_14905, partial [Clostridiaceae bacterium]|nr:hypothetical protein [Clostridiaceae bacterium]